MKRKPRTSAPFGRVCDHCAPRPDPKYATMPLEWFIGKNVKIGAKTDPKPADCPPDFNWPETEHIWVEVICLPNEDVKDAELVGKINCQEGPFFLQAQGYVDGTIVGINRSEIEDVFEET